MQPYRYLDYMSDAFIEAYGRTLEEAFSNAALGMLNVMLDVEKVKAIREDEVEVEGIDLENLLYNWLESILLKVWTDQFVPCEFKLKIEKDGEGYRLKGKLRGEPYKREKHGYKTEVKAVTYHEMSISKEGEIYKLRFLLDL